MTERDHRERRRSRRRLARKLRRNLPGIFAAGFVAAILLVGSIAYVHHSAAPIVSGPAPAPFDSGPSALRGPDTRPIPGRGATALIIGDSYTEGEGAPSGAGWADHLAAEMGWKADIESSWGAGYLTAGRDGSSINSVASALNLAKLDPDVIVVQAGHNDVLQRNPDGVEQAAEATLEILRTADLRTPIVVIGTFWPEPMRGVVTETDSAIRQAAAAFTGTLFLDPLAEGWGRGFGTVDGTHPNAAGHRMIAERIADGIRSAGLLGS